MKSVTFLILAWSFGIASSVFAQDEFNRNELDQEQRLVEAHLREARKEIDRSVGRINASLTNTALLTIFRADEDLSRAEGILSFHPQHIEKLVRSLFYDEERVRSEFREKYDVIDASYDEIEKEFWVLVDEFDRVTGRTGNRSLRAMLQRLDELRAIRDDENASAEERAAAAEALRNHDALIASGDGEGALEDLAEATGGGDTGGNTGGGGTPAPSSIRLSNPAAPWTDMGGAPEGVWIPATTASGETVQVRRTRECDVPNAPPGCRDTYEVKQADGSIMTFHNYDPVENPDGSISVRNDSRTTYPDGSYDVVSEERHYDPSTCELKVVRTTTRFNKDGTAKGDQVVETAFYKDCDYDPRGDRRAELDPSKQIAGQGSVEVISPSGEKKVYPLSGDEPRTERRGEYVGGKGMFLISESEYSLSYERDDYGAIRGVAEKVGRQRNWEFAVAEVPGSIAYNDDLTAMTAQFTLVDGKGKKSFTIDTWQVKAPDGSVIAQGQGNGPFDVRTTTSGQFEFIVRGKTDWGSAFTITQMVNMNL